MKLSAPLFALRSLSRSGLNAEVFIPAALEALHRIVPSYRNLFDWTDAQGNLIRYYFEGPIDHRVAALYFEQFHNRLEGAVMPAFRQAVTGKAIIHGDTELNRAEFFHSALYNEIWRPQGLHTRLEAIVKDTRGTPLGSLVLYRGRGDRRFNADDERLLASAVPYIARGIEAGQEAATAGDYVREAGRTASLNLDPNGELSHLSQEALKMLMLAHGGVTPESVSRTPRREDFGALNLVWQHHLRSQGMSREGTSVALENAWGEFVFTSEPLVPVGDAQPQFVHVAIQHLRPRIVAMRTVLDQLPLSPVQREVCALLHQGHSQTEIADSLAVAPSTVSDHVRKIYAKLDVHSVAELSARIRRVSPSGV